MDRITWENLTNRFKWLVAVAKERGIDTKEWELLQLAPRHYVMSSNRTGMLYSRPWQTKREAYEGLEDMARGLMLIKP